MEEDMRNSIKTGARGVHEELVIEDEEDFMLPGFRFHPTDEELVAFYLRRKVEKKRISMEIIKQLDIYKYEPWDLSRASTVTGEKELYFFCLRGRKYKNSVRPNRVTGCGFWKATGVDRPIYSSSGECVGLKKSLVYYRGSAGKGTKTDWMMHEFRLPLGCKDDSNNSSIQEAEIWTVCRIFKRNVSPRKYPQPVQDWRDSNRSPKTSSLESDAGDDHCNLISFDERSQTFPVQCWNSIPETPSAMFQQHAESNLIPATNVEFFRDGNWDELDRIMEFVMETNVAYT